MNEKAAKGIVFFLFAMFLFTFVSWKLDDLRTPQVLCDSLWPGSIGGTDYNVVVPSEAVWSDTSGTCVYLLEDSKSWFYPVVARRYSVSVLASEGGMTAITGVYRPAQLIRLSDRTLSGSVVPVEVREEDAAAGRVEVLPFEDLDAAEKILRKAAESEKKDWEISQEKDRLVLENADRFTAQMAQAALSACGVEAEVFDYTWGPAVLAQSGRIWLAWAAVLGLWVLWGFLWRQGRREWDRAQTALEDQYLGTYLADAGVRLLAGGTLLAVSVIATVAAVQWFWRVEIALPRDLLPEGSVFDLEHYRAWAAATFPEGWCSAYGAELASQLKRSGLLALAECGGLTICAVVLHKLLKDTRSNESC